jgi:transketolase
VEIELDTNDPVWPDSDRFVLAGGHASTLLWSLLHLSGARAVDPGHEVLGTPAVSLDDLKSLRQPGSECRGHREYRWTSGALATKGPLGQGVATSAGMAIAAAWLGAR